MFPSKTFLLLIFIALSAVDASPLSRLTGKATLSFATKISERSTLSIVEKDRARVQAMKQTGQLGKRSTSFSITNTGVTYNAEVGIGDPATTCT
jgi:saccharopepsin